MMIEICTFGGLVVRKANCFVCTDLGNVTGELLTYLAIQAKSALRRERVAELFWPEKSAARSRASLNTSIWRINESLGHAGIRDHIEIERVTEHTISLKLDANVVVDSTALSDAVARCDTELSQDGALSQKARDELSRALDGYRNGFLDGIDSEWVIRAREKYRCLHARGMTILMRDYARTGRIEEALTCGRAILEQDEFREATQRAVMWLHIMNGQRNEAIERYRRLTGRLMEEIGVEPMAETMSLYHHILGDSDLPDAPPRADTGRAAVPRSIADVLRSHGERRISVFETIISPEMRLH